MQEELQDYFRLLAVLEQELMKGNSSVKVDANNTGTQGLTLLRLKAWLYEPIDR
jgi:hypothetical protein